MDQHSLGARTWISIAPRKALRSNAWTVRTWLWCPCCSGNVPFRSDSAVHVVEVIACEILQICRDCRGIFSICLVRMKSDEVKPARDASCAVDRLIEGSLEVILPAIWTDEKQRWEESEKRRGEKRREEKKKEDQRRESQKKGDAGARKGRKVAKHCVFPMICGKRVRSHLARCEIKNCTPLWREAHCQVKMYKTHHAWTTIGSWLVEKVYAVVARSAYPGQNVKSTTCSDHFRRFRCDFAWHAQGILHLAKSEQNVRVLSHFQKRWQPWDIWRGSGKMHFAWQAQYKRHLHQRC